VIFGGLQTQQFLPTLPPRLLCHTLVIGNKFVFYIPSDP
jgi:hypothetical protein